MRSQNEHKKALKILFFTPYAGRTGSEIMLFSLLNKLDPEKFEIELVALRNGELLSHPNNFPTGAIDDKTIATRAENFIRKKVTGKGVLEKRLLAIQKKFNADLWYLNTIVMPEVAEIATRHDIPFALHIHELQFQFSLISDEDLKMQVSRSAFNIVCSNAVGDAIRAIFPSEPQLLYECVDLASIETSEKKTTEFKKKHAIPSDHRILVMAGQRSEIKGFDIFIDVSRLLCQEKITFVWLGNSRNSGYNLYYESVIKNEKLNVVLDYPDPAQYYSALDAADLFFLSSRSDPFPLVMIEAAYLGKYIFALPSGGAAEFCSTGAGTIFPSFDPGSIAIEIRKILNAKPSGWHKAISTQRAKEFDVLSIARQLEKFLLDKLSR